jgi:hypothetical protein
MSVASSLSSSTGTWDHEAGRRLQPARLSEKGNQRQQRVFASSREEIFTAIEVKRPDGRASPAQFIESVRRNKGVAQVAYSLDDIPTLFLK